MTTKLQDSFAALYSALETPRVARWTVAVLLVIHTLLLGYSAYVHSPTLNEPGHLVAGLSYWRFGRFDVYNVNPPLVKMVAALPVIGVAYEEDWSGFTSGPGARPEMGMGESFVAANGERSFLLFMIARWVCIPFSWLGAIVCYLWAHDLYGRPSGVMACAFWCFEPNILAHASLITSDAAGCCPGLGGMLYILAVAADAYVVAGCADGRCPRLGRVGQDDAHSLLPSLAVDVADLSLVGPPPHAGHRLAPREAGMLAQRMVIGLYVLRRPMFRILPIVLRRKCAAF